MKFKFLLAFIIAILGTTALVSCKKSDEKEPTKTETNEVETLEPTTKEPTVKPTEEVEETTTPDAPIDQNLLYSKRYGKIAQTYTNTVKDLYWVSKIEASNLIPGMGTPYLWPYTEQIGMAADTLKTINKEIYPDKWNLMAQYLRELIEGVRYYRVEIKDGYTTTPFGVLSADLTSQACYSGGRASRKDSSGATKGGIYFDDNIWVCKELYEAYKVLGDEAYLNEALNILNFILANGYETAVDKKTGIAMNGIYWLWGAKDKHPGVTNDSENASLNACSTAPTAMMCLKFYNELTNPKFNDLKEEYLAKGKKMYNFLYKVLVDETKNVVVDKVFINKDSKGNLEFGLIDRQTLGYNTGCTLTLSAELYKYAVNSKNNAAAKLYLKRALEMVEGGDINFGSITTLKGEYAYGKHSWFTGLFLEGVISVSLISEEAYSALDHLRSSLDYGWEHHKDEQGLVSPSWIIGWSDFTETGVNEQNPRQVLLQAANAHNYARLANIYREIALKKA